MADALTAAEYAMRLERSRRWHLYQAGAARNRAAVEAREAETHEAQAVLLGRHLRDLGYDPNGGQP